MVELFEWNGRGPISSGWDKAVKKAEYNHNNISLTMSN